MNRKHLPVGFVDRTGLRRWFEAEFGYKPGYYTISKAIRQGMPCEPHPLLDGKLVFRIEKVREWVESRGKRKVMQPSPLRAALAH